MEHFINIGCLKILVCLFKAKIKEINVAKYIYEI